MWALGATVEVRILNSCYNVLYGSGFQSVAYWTASSRLLGVLTAGKGVVVGVGVGGGGQRGVVLAACFAFPPPASSKLPVP